MAFFNYPARTYRPVPAVWLALGAVLLLVIALVVAQRLSAQIEGERGIAPLASSKDIQVAGIEVNVTGKSAEEARLAGWKLAQRKAWEKIDGPKMSDSQIDAMVSAIVIEREQIGPRRYIAKLGVVFDRQKAGGFLGRGDSDSGIGRSAPLLVIPVLYSGGVRQVFEVRGPWQRAWANFQTAQSPIDYIRPTGAGGESLILTAGQTSRRSRLWWRNVLDQFETSDVLIPVARLERQWPGGPVRGTFTARYGPDNRFLESFTLTADSDRALPAMLEQAVLRMDAIYRRALSAGLLTPDPTLLTGEAVFDQALAKLRSEMAPRREETEAVEGPVTATPTGQPTSPDAVATYAVQFATPDARAVDMALAAVRGAPGVQSVATSSIAIGGTSVMRVTMSGSLDSLTAALRNQGWQVTAGSSALRISR